MGVGAAPRVRTSVGWGSFAMEYRYARWWFRELSNEIEEAEGPRSRRIR